MTRGEFLGGCLVALLITCAPGLAGVVVTALTGPDRLDAPSSRPSVSGEVTGGREATPWVTPRPRVSEAREASRSRAVVRHAAGGVGGLNWTALAACESSGDPTTDTGNGYYGLYQFDLPTWASVGGRGDPAHASRAEQTYRAQLLFADRGRQPWPVCGARL